MVTARRKYCRIRSGSARRNYPTPLTFRNALARAQPNVRTRPWFQSRRASPDVRSSTACGWRGHFGRRGASAGFLRRWDRLDWRRRRCREGNRGGLLALEAMRSHRPDLQESQMPECERISRFSRTALDPVGMQPRKISRKATNEALFFDHFLLRTRVR